MTRRVEPRLLLAGGLVVLLLVVISAVTYDNTHSLLNDAKGVVQSHEVRSLTAGVMQSIVDAEASQRGFLITGGEDFLEPYHAALDRWEPRIDRLAEQTVDNSLQQGRILRLRKLVADRVAILQEGIEIRRRSEAEARAFVAEGRGRRAMAAVRALISEIESSEEVLLEQRKERMAREYRYAVTSGLGMSLAGLVLVGGIVQVLNRHLHSRAEAAARLHQQRELLRATLTSIGDGVIATDVEGKVTFLNPVAEALTGWSQEEACGKSLTTVFRVVNENSREPVPNPSVRAIQEGMIVGLTNHTLLIAQDGAERAIDDCAGPIRDARGDVSGAVLIFRDVTDERNIRRALAEEVKLSTFELEIIGAVAQSNGLAAMLSACADLLLLHFDCAQACIWTFNDVEQVLELRGDAGCNIGPHDRCRRVGLGEGVIGRIAKERRPLTSDGALGDVRPDDQDWALAAGFVVFAAYPLLVDERLVGAMALFGRHPLSEVEKHALTVASNSVALAVERKRAEERVQEARDRLDAALAAGRIGTFVWNLRSDRLQWDAFNRELYRLRPDQVMDTLQNFLALVHPDDRATVLRSFNACAAHRTPLDVEFRCVGDDGAERWFINRGSAVMDANGDPSFLVGACVDITEQKFTQHAMRENERQFHILADSIPHLAWMARPDGHIFWYNQRWYDYTGTTLEEMEGWGWQSVHDPAELPRVVERLKHSFATGEPWEDVFPLRRRDGQFRWHLSRMLPIRDPYGRIARWFGTNTDITEQRDAAAALRDADARKDEFLAMLGHELRNPLAGILTGAQALGMLDSNPAAAEMQAVIDRQATHMSRIVDDLLDVSRIGQGKLRLRREPLDLNALIASTSHDYRSLHPLEKCELRSSLPDGEVWVMGDKTRLAQVFTNLIQNGCKFSDGVSDITLTLEVDAAVGRARVAITDRGIGMTEDTLQRIFDPFHQADATLNRSRGGLGLGLALARGIIDLHEGKIEAYSEGLGRGSTFVVTLPLEQRRATPEPTKSSALSPMARLKVLLIDDRRDAILPLEKMLGLRGHQVVTAADGASGIARARELLPDVVLCDVGLTREMSGYEVARAVRSTPELSTTYLVAVTGYGQDDDRRRAREMGFDFHATKPLSHDQLFDLVYRMPRFSDEE
jgi:PAS domain S-box-containing protein